MARITNARIRRQFERRTAALAGDLRRALLRAFDALGDEKSQRELVRLIEAGDLDALVSAADVEQALAPFRVALRDGVESAGAAATRLLPGDAARRVFDVLTARNAAAVEALHTRVVTTLSEDVRAGLKDHVRRALAGGASAPRIAREIRDVIGLAPNQVEAVANFRGLLEAGDPAVLERALRDRRFDATLRRKLAEGLSPQEIDAMVAAYQRRFIAFNADVNVRTAAADAQKTAHHLAWEQAVERGDVDGATLTKRWSGVLDDRERDEHLAMEGETVPYDQPYSNGQMTPGDGEFNCRCVSIYETAGKVQPGVGRRAP